MKHVTLIFAVLACAFVCEPDSASAHQATFVAPTQHDVVAITDVTLSQGFYGELDDFPHTYTFTFTEPTTVFAEILVPHLDSATNDKSGLVLEVLPDDNGVREVKRLPAKEASWESFYEWFAGDSYRRGPTFFDSLSPGTYLFEVSTPVNKGKYVLVVGKREEGKGYIATAKDIARVKEFFEKPRIAIVQSPFVFVPLILLLILGYIVYRRMRIRFRS